METITRLNTAESPAERQLAFDQVEDLLKLQKAAQQISSILELDRLIEPDRRTMWRCRSAASSQIFICTTKNAES